MWFYGHVISLNTNWFMPLMPLGGADVVLGIQWLIKVGYIKWNFRQQKMEFQIGEKKISVKGSQPRETKMVTNQKMQKVLIKYAQLSMMFTTFVHPSHQQSTMQTINIQSQQLELHDDLQALLNTYSSLFEVPTALPPHKDHNHRIVLKEGTSPINVRPYRYPASQKDKTKRMIDEMLSSRIIRPSVSPYSSPIEMVKKKYGSWRLCIDYQQLNNYNVKDKFSILVIEKLLDELGGSKYFFKLDLRSGYH